MKISKLMKRGVRISLSRDGVSKRVLIPAYRFRVTYPCGYSFNAAVHESYDGTGWEATHVASGLGMQPTTYETRELALQELTERLKIKGADTMRTAIESLVKS